MFGIQKRIKTALVGGTVFVLGIASLGQGLSVGTVHAAHARAVIVHVTLREFSVTLSRHQLPARTPIRFVITNRGKVMHEAVLEKAGADDKALKVGGKEYEADDIAPGTTRSVTWTVPQAGAYQLACHMPGHFQMGMKALLTVTPQK